MQARDVMTTTPMAGAMPDGEGTTFCVWAPRATRVEVRLFADARREMRTTMLRTIGGGWFEERLAGGLPGALYKFVLDGRELPAPYARFLPFGVHGPAQVVARVSVPRFERAPPLERYVIYELHVGTFTPEGTYASASERLVDLADLGV